MLSHLDLWLQPRSNTGLRIPGLKDNTRPNECPHATVTTKWTELKSVLSRANLHFHFASKRGGMVWGEKNSFSKSFLPPYVFNLLLSPLLKGSPNPTNALTQPKPDGYYARHQDERKIVPEHRWRASEQATFSTHLSERRWKRKRRSQRSRTDRFCWSQNACRKRRFGVHNEKRKWKNRHEILEATNSAKKTRKNLVVWLKSGNSPDRFLSWP